MGGVLPLLMLAPVLLIVAYCDLRHMRIPNMLSLIALGLFALCALMLPPADLALRLAAAGAVLLIGIAAFGFGLFGGGDVKILSVLLLFVPVAELSAYAYLFAFSMSLGIAAILAARRLGLGAHGGWRALAAGERGFPMGISIALSGLLLPLFMALMQG